MEPLHIIKIGGDIIDDPQAREVFLRVFAEDVAAPKILVHGGGKMVTDLAARLGIPVRMVNGRRITDGQSLELAVMVFAGLINKSLTAGLQALSCPAVGLSGADGGAIQSTKRIVADIDFGFVGDIKNINNRFFQILIKNNYVPVICALTADDTGQLLNTNADTIASTLAIALNQEYECILHFAMKLPGVLARSDDPDSLISVLSRDRYQDLREKQFISGGMIPKLDNAFFAREKGVKKIYICGYNDLQNTQKGTVLI